MARSTYDLTRECNGAVSGLMDTLVTLNAQRHAAELQGWSVVFVIQHKDVDVTISRDSWPRLDDESAS